MFLPSEGWLGLLSSSERSDETHSLVRPQPLPAVAHTGCGAQRHPDKQRVPPRITEPGPLMSCGEFNNLPQLIEVTLLCSLFPSYLFLSLNSSSDFCWLHIFLAEYLVSPCHIYVLSMVCYEFRVLVILKQNDAVCP